MDIAEIFSLNFELKLSEGLHKRHALNITYGPTQLNDTDIRTLGLR